MSNVLILLSGVNIVDKRIKSLEYSICILNVWVGDIMSLKNRI